MGRRRLILILCAVTAVLAAALAASAAATTVRVKAVVTGVSQPSLRLRIVRNGRTVYDQAVRSRPCAGGCISTAVLPGKSPVFVGFLQPAAEPAVVLGLYTGGAHCCFVHQVFTYDAAHQAYVKTEHNFLDAGPVIQRLAGKTVFRSADARIAEDAFTDYADSGAPVQIWGFSHRRFQNITRQFPVLIKTDAARWLAAFNHHTSNGVGFIAAWAADEDLLGNHALVTTTLNSLARRHKLHSALGLPGGSETRFVSELEQQLRQFGYR